TLPDSTPFFAHEYGAMIFAVFVDDFHGGPDVVKATFANAGENDDAINAIASAAGNSDAAELFAEFAADNATWAYPAVTRAKIDAWSSTYADPIGLRVGVGDDATFDGEHVLHAYGYGVAAVARDARRAVDVVVTLDQASGDGAGVLRATL